MSVVELVSPEDGTDPDKDLPQIDLFSINGVMFSIPDRAKPNVVQAYLYYGRTRGVGFAESWLAETMLGTEAYLALLNFKQLTQEQATEIYATARSVVFGEIRPKGVQTAPKKKAGARSSTGAARRRSNSSKQPSGS